MAVKLGKFPSEVLDPEGIHLSGMDRLLFDGILVGKGAEQENLASGTEDGIPAATRAEFALSRVDSREYDELEKLKEKMRTNGRGRDL
jgi:hypothetical protein